MEKKLQKGFTLIEVVVAIGLFAVLMLAISVIFVNLYHQQRTDVAALKRVQKVSQTIDTMSDEIRKGNSGVDGEFIIAQAENNNFVFYSDVDNDGKTEKVSYFLDGTNFKKKVIEPTSNPDNNYQSTGTTIVVCDNIKTTSTPIFTYYDGSYTGTQDPLAAPVAVLAVRTVGIDFTVNSSSSKDAYPIHIETHVQIRNLK